MTHVLNNFLLYMLIVSCLIIFIIAVMTAWRQGRRSLLSWFMIPFVIFNMGFAWYTVEQLRGWPYYAEPSKTAELMYGHATREYIYLLVDHKDDGPRLYAIDYTAEDAKKLQQAMESKKQGNRVMLGTESKQELEFYKFQVDRVYNKKPK